MSAKNTREPFPPDHTPAPPQVIDPRQSPEQPDATSQEKPRQQTGDVTSSVPDHAQSFAVRFEQANGLWNAHRTDDATGSAPAGVGETPEAALHDLFSTLQKSNYQEDVKPQAS